MINPLPDEIWPRARLGFLSEAPCSRLPSEAHTPCYASGRSPASPRATFVRPDSSGREESESQMRLESCVLITHLYCRSGPIRGSVQQETAVLLL